MFRCLFSIDSGCFIDPNSEYREVGRKIFQPRIWVGVKLMLMSICPILRDFLPFAFVPRDVDRWFRKLMHEIREERKLSPIKHEDFYQLLLNSVEKFGGILCLI